MVRHGLADGFGRGNAPIGGTDIGYFVVDANGREGLLFLAALAANVNGGARELCGGGLGERERCVCVRVSLAYLVLGKDGRPLFGRSVGEMNESRSNGQRTQLWCFHGRKGAGSRANGKPLG